MINENIPKYPVLHAAIKRKTTGLILSLLILFPFAASAQWDTLSLVFAGDIMGHTPQIKSAEVIPNKKYNYEPCFQYLKPIIEKADIAIGNLELTLPGKPPYSGYPMFRSPDELADALKLSGFDVLVTANNHSNDARGPGVVSTVNTLRDKGFLQTGTFKDARDRAAFYPQMIYKDGFKFALLNYTYGTNGLPTTLPTVVNLIDTVQIKKDLAEAVARQPDFIIVFMHWGLEYQLQENAEQRKLAKFLIANGAQLIIGSHPHVVQPVKWETATAPDGSTKKALVVYSLGNFISNQQKAHTNGGILFEVKIVKNKGVRKAELDSYGYLPVYRYVHKEASGKRTYYALPIARMEKYPELFKEMDSTERAAMTAFANSVRKRLQECPEIK